MGHFDTDGIGIHAKDISFQIVIQSMEWESHLMDMMKKVEGGIFERLIRNSCSVISVAEILKMFYNLSPECSP